MGLQLTGDIVAWAGRVQAQRRGVIVGVVREALMLFAHILAILCGIQVTLELPRVRS